MARLIHPRMNAGGGITVGRQRLKFHAHGEGKIHYHPNDRNASTAIRSVTPARMGFKNRVGKEPKY